MSEKVLRPLFSDNRVAELRETLKTVINEYTSANNVSYAFVIGVLDNIKFEMWLDCYNVITTDDL